MQVADIERIAREGVEALRLGRAAEARSRFEQVTMSGRANIQIWLLLATACRAQGDAAAEEAALDRVLEIEPRTVRAHIMKADCRLKAGDDRSAQHYYRSALHSAEGQRVPDDLLAELRRAEAAMTSISAQLAARREENLAAAGFPPGQRSARFQQALDIGAGQKQIFLQEPTVFYFPGLPQIQYYDTQAFDWVPALEAGWRAIRAEIEAALAVGTQGFRPYIQTEANRTRLDYNPLLDSADWSTLFLCENSHRDEAAIARFPRTWAAVQAAPLPLIPKSSPTVMFSLLRAGARINPHTGVHNARLTCHLPLIVPPDCGFRVGNEVRQWEEGKLLVFDDSIEHEAWNGSAQDRVVLIFDIWRPELSEQERRELTALFQGAPVD
jgi:aspartyl/asparaginyl beta-hydroxylase (cupin superfamily)